MKKLLLLLSLLLSGCCRQPLTLYTEFIGVEQYASYHVGTPDPALACPELGQVLFVKWDLPPAIMSYPNLHVEVTIRYYDGSEEIALFPIRKRDETCIWKVVNEFFDCTGGIATYRAIIYSETVPIYSWDHVLWNRTIKIGDYKVCEEKRTEDDEDTGDLEK